MRMLQLSWNITASCLRRLIAPSASDLCSSAGCSWSGASQYHNGSVEKDRLGGQPNTSNAIDRRVAPEALSNRRTQQARKRNMNVGKHAGEWEDEAAQQVQPQDSDSSDCMMDHRGMQLVFLGTSSSVPTITRNTSCIALRLHGTIYMFDSGEGVQRQLQRTPFRLTSIDNIFITHMHGDHIFGLPGMLAPPTKEPLQIFGPSGLRQWIRTTMKACHARVFPKYAVHELVLQQGRSLKRVAVGNSAADRHEDELPGEDIVSSKDGLWHVHEDDRYTVKAGLLAHTIPCWGYVLEERPRPGRFCVDRALEAGVKPGPLFGELQKGHSVTLSNGKVVQAGDVLGQTRRGRKVVILGDTSDSKSLLHAARGADVVVHEATLIEQDAAEANRRGHSTATMAGEFAKAVDAKKLVLTHFSGKLEGALSGFSERGAGTVQDLVGAAKAVFGKDVVAAKDLLALTVFSTDEPAPAIPRGVDARPTVDRKAEIRNSPLLEDMNIDNKFCGQSFSR